MTATFRILLLLRSVWLLAGTTAVSGSPSGSEAVAVDIDENDNERNSDDGGRAA
jgi:hypothetical protein